MQYDVAIIGTGMGSLSAGALLARDGMRVLMLEQNWIPGGCTSSYWRKGFVFESGATTLVGLDQNMPLQYVLSKTNIPIKTRKLDLPMQVHMPGLGVINKYQSLDQWIEEAEKKFGKKGQRAFWEFCFKISNFVWNTSIKQRQFPPTRINDLWSAAQNVSLDQLKFARYALVSMEGLLRKYDLLQNEKFVRYVNEQLLITAQNYLTEVNVLFGATALCYTNYDNHYVDGGLINLVKPFVTYIEQNGGKVILRDGVELIERQQQYQIRTKKGQYQAEYLISGIPVNNTLTLYPNGYSQHISKKLMQSGQLNSAFQMGIGFKPHRTFDSIHHQIHLDTPLSQTGSNSIFVSLNHPEDTTRTDETGMCVASVSTHIPDPAYNQIDAEPIVREIFEALEKYNFVKRENIVYSHNSGPKSWMKWTGRAFGFVGGYPQFMSVKPWQMLDARLDGHKAYQCGDTVYPGQGIPGTTLSGIIAYEKLKADWL